MFHTISLFKNLSCTDYMEIDKTLAKHSRSYLVPNQQNGRKNGHAALRRYAFINFDGIRGVRMYLTRKTVYLDSGIHFTKSYLHLVVNPKAILNKDYISVANEADGIKAFAEINKYFQSIGISLKCHDFKTTRIDCCYNYRYFDKHGNPSAEMAKDSLELLKRGKYPARFILGQYYNEKGKRFLPYENSLVYKNNSVVINIYDKYAQMVEKTEENPHCEAIFFPHDSFISDEIVDEVNDINAVEAIDSFYNKYENDSPITLEDARGIIRFEVSCRYHKLYSIINGDTWDYNTLNVYNFISDDFTESILLYYLEEICFPGDYFSLEEARLRIIESNIKCHAKTKESLLTLLEQVSRHQGWERTAKKLSMNPMVCHNDKEYNFSSWTIHNLLTHLASKGINLVTIPKNWNSDYFPNPVSLIGDAIILRAESQHYDTVFLQFLE